MPPVGFLARIPAALSITYFLLVDYERKFYSMLRVFGQNHFKLIKNKNAHTNDVMSLTNSKNLYTMAEQKPTDVFT